MAEGKPSVSKRKGCGGLSAILGFLEQFNDKIGSILWGPVMIFLLAGSGLYLTLFSGGFQFRYFVRMLGCTVCSLFRPTPKKQTGITPFQAVSTALAGTMGVGNIVGVATALTAGGPGAVFWMVVSSFLGMMTKFAEVVLSVKFRRTDSAGRHYGGPMYYLERLFPNRKALPRAFALLCVLASFGIGNMTQSNAMAGAMLNTFSVHPALTGCVAMLLIGLVIVGGIQRIGKVSEMLIPVISIFYLLGSLIALALHAGAIPAALVEIWNGAFHPAQVGAGVLGYTVSSALRFGFARGVFSNEAGLGSATIAHAATSESDPVRQGFWGIFEVFADTVVVCTLTALVILTSGVMSDPTLDGEALIGAAFAASFGGFGRVFIALSVLLFAVASIIGWSYYGECCVNYLSGNRPGMLLFYRVIFLFLVVVGATVQLRLVWNAADVLNGLMAVPNLIGVVGLSPVVYQEIRRYRREEQKR